MVSSTLKLGISILNGGNADVQQVTGEGTWEEAKRGGGSPVTPTSPAPPASSVENAGLSEGQEGSGLLPEYPGTDADVQVGASGYLAVKPFGVAGALPLVPPPGTETYSKELKYRGGDYSNNKRL